MQNHFYSGIGSRSTPTAVLDFMTRFAIISDKSHYILRSGGAKGADQAFADGTDNKLIFRPENTSNKAIDIAEKFHPNWSACNHYVRRLHGRNIEILLGKDLNQPSAFIICWTPQGKVVGGTGMALRAAEFYDIPVINLGEPEFQF